MTRVLTIARSEYLRAVGTKAFILGVVLMPVLFGGGIITMVIAEKATDTADRHFAVVDRTGQLYPAIAAAAQERNETDVFDADEDGRQVAPRWIPELHDAGEDAAATRLQLSGRVDDGELLGFLELGADVFSVAGGGDRALSWHTETPTYDDLPDWLDQVVNGEIRQQRFAASGLDAGLVAKLSARSRVRTLGLTRQDAGGAIVEGDEKDVLASVIVPIGLVALMFMLVMMSTPALMNNVLEEKMQRIAEVLVSAVRPFDLLLGKLLSAVMVSFTLAVLYVGAALLFLHNMDTFLPSAEPVPPAFLEALGPGTLGLFGLFMVLALVIYGSVFSALGAACSELQDAQTLVGPAMIVLMVPMFFIGPVIKSPDGTLATVLSFFPPATPVLMFLRVSMPPGVAWWELATALATTTVFTLLCVGAAARIFRIGILAQGQTPSWRRLLGWAFSK